MMHVIQVKAYSQVWWAVDEPTQNPVPLFREETDTEPFLIVPRSEVTLAPLFPEPTGIGVPVWDNDKRIWFKRHDTGDWVSPNATGFDTTDWVGMAHPTHLTPPRWVPLADPDSDQARLLAGELRKWCQHLTEHPEADASVARRRMMLIIKGNLG